MSGDDTGLRSAAQLLAELGARVVGDAQWDEPGLLCALAVEPGRSARPDCPVVLTARATPTQDWARSGAMHLTGRADGPPRPAPGAPASALRGWLLVLEALTLARGAAVPAPPQWPGVRLLGERAALAGLQRRGPVSAGGAFRPVRAADGWLGLSLARPGDLDLLPALVEAPVVGDPWDAVAAWAADQTAADAAARAQLLGLPCARVVQPGVYDDEQARDRGGCEPRPVVCSPGGRRRQMPARPLVVDLTAMWAGPLCAHLLALTGARVVKVESIDRPDGARGGEAAFYDLLHAGTESVALDLRSTSGRRALHELVRQADVVLESSRPRALRQLGVDAHELVDAGTIWTSITAYGRRGPWSSRVGFGDDVAAAAGLVVVDEGVPLPCGDALADPLTGVHAAVATAAALLDERAHLLDVSMRDVCASTVTAGTAAATHADEHDADERIAAALPWARPVPGPAAPLGADTTRVLGEVSRP